LGGSIQVATFAWNEWQHSCRNQPRGSKSKGGSIPLKRNQQSSQVSAFPTSSSSSMASFFEDALTAEKSPFCQRQMNSGIRQAPVEIIGGWLRWGRTERKWHLEVVWGLEQRAGGKWGDGIRPFALKYVDFRSGSYSFRTARLGTVNPSTKLSITDGLYGDCTKILQF
jgi:hypothetical protein